MVAVIHVPGVPRILIPGRNYPINGADLLKAANQAPTIISEITPPVRKILREIGITTQDSFVKSAK